MIGRCAVCILLLALTATTPDAAAASPAAGAVATDAAPRTSAAKLDAQPEARRDRGVGLSPGVSSSLYVRVDSDRTLVVTPEVHFKTQREGNVTNVDLVYLADSWSSASVDIRTAATTTVRERRDEADVGLRRTIDTSELSLGYRFSHETDYISNAVSLGLRHEAFSRNTTLEARVSGALDIVRRSGDAFFERQVRSFGVWLGFTQILSKTTLLQLSYENRGAFGYLASPYRFVAVGGGGHCGPTAILCVPEIHPTRRIRHAAVVRLRQAVSKAWSLGAAYRFYVDDWKIISHTGMADVRWQPKQWAMLVLDYRYYQQSGTFFYAMIYQRINAGDYLTRDRELSPMASQRLGLRFELNPVLASGRVALVTGLMVTGTLFRYDEFIDLKRTRALESSVQFGLQF